MKLRILYTSTILIILVLFTGCSEHKIYLHQDTPCVGKIFIPEKETILLQKEKHYAYGEIYALSIYDLEVYDKYVKEENITYERLHNNSLTVYRKEIKIYPQGSAFKVLGFYTITSKSFENSSELSYYLIRSFDDNKTIWLYAPDFNSTQCNIESSSDWNAYSFNLEETRGLAAEYKSTSINNEYFMPDSYSYFEDMLSVSKKRMLGK